MLKVQDGSRGGYHAVLVPYLERSEDEETVDDPRWV